MNDYIRGIVATTGVFLVGGAIFAAGHRTGKKTGVREFATQHMIDVFDETSHRELNRAAAVMKKAEELYSDKHVFDEKTIMEWFGIASPSSVFSPEGISEEQSKSEPKPTVDTHADVMFSSREATDVVLDELQRRINKVGYVTVNEFFALANVEGTNSRMNDIRGWTNLHNVPVRRRNDGLYWFDMPVLEPLNRDRETPNPELELQIINDFTETPMLDSDFPSKVLYKMKQQIEKSGNVSIAEYRTFLDPMSVPMYEEDYVGWTDLGNATIQKDRYESYFLNLPKPVVLSGVKNTVVTSDGTPFSFSFTGMSFKSKAAAENAAQGLRQKEAHNGWVSVSDYHDVVSKPRTKHGDKYGWSTVQAVKAVPDDKGWTLDLPPVTYLPV